MVRVEDGVAVLTGTVTSPLERDGATECAFAGGAIDVKSELQISRRAS